MSRRARKPAVLTLTLVLLLGLLTGVQVAAPLQAQAAPVTDFDPGNIISDSVMYDASTMNAASVQAFLDARGASCKPAAGSTCIKSYRESTPSRAVTAMCPGGYTGVPNERAADIIAKVSVACGINPQVLLVTLQKEQGLITSTAGKTAYTYSRALGFGCPDNVGGWCNPSYAGFANQVYSAANQLKRYAAGLAGSYRAGRVNTILWNPNAACGSSQVYIENQATASLYSYTPYRPNGAALAAGFGSGDSCSSYGNRNFHLYFQAWFGSAKQRAPVGAVDSVGSPAGSGSIRVTGWALDPDTTASIRVHVYVDGTMTRDVAAANPRPDVGAAHGRGDRHGYDVTVPAAGGTRQVCVFAIDSSGGTNPSLGCRTVIVANQAPVGSLDSVVASAGTITVAGWALDPDTTASINVHLYVDGRAVASERAKTARPDVGRVYGKGDLHGFTRTLGASDGAHQVCAYAIDATGGANPRLGCRTVTVRNAPPRGTLDAATSSAPGQVTVRGWAFDPDSSSAIAVHLYVDGKLARGVTANRSRPDVARAHAVGANHGYDVVLPVVRGNHTVCAYGIDASSGTNPQLGCSPVSVADTPTVGTIETVTPRAATAAVGRTTGSSVTVAGWAWDFDTTSAVAVRVLVDGRLATTVTAGSAHAAVPGAGRTTIGFGATVPASVGQHAVCAEGVDPKGGTTALGCSTVTVADALPIGVFDGVTSPAPRSIRVTGWAFDPDTTAPTPVHVHVDGVPVLSTPANVSRPDVTTAYGIDGGHGFDARLTVTSGQHTVCTYAINVKDPALHSLLGCLPVTVG